MTMVRDWRAALADPDTARVARTAMGMFKGYCHKGIGPAPGMDTFSRLALRVHYGRTAEQAACREYLYRWNLALTSSVFGVPHAVGA